MCIRDRATVERMYAETEENQFLEVTYAGGDKEVLYFKDFSSGAMIQNVVDRAKKLAIKEALDAATATDGAKSTGITAAHLHEAIAAEQAESEYVPTSANPEEWAKIVAGTSAGAYVTQVELMGV